MAMTRPAVDDDDFLRRKETGANGTKAAACPASKSPMVAVIANFILLLLLLLEKDGKQPKQKSRQCQQGGKMPMPKRNGGTESAATAVHRNRRKSKTPEVVDLWPPDCNDGEAEQNDRASR